MCEKLNQPKTEFCKSRLLSHDNMRGLIKLFRWDALPNPDVSPGKSEAGLTALFSEIRSTVDTEAQIVKAVFPNPPMVMQVFLQRVFAQSVRSFEQCPQSLG